MMLSLFKMLINIARYITASFTEVIRNSITTVSVLSEHDAVRLLVYSRPARINGT